MVKTLRALGGGEDGIPDGFPIVVDKNLAIIEPVFEYLIYLATIRGRTRSADTIRTYAESLYDVFDALEQSGFDWRDWKNITEEILARYRNRMETHISPVSNRPYTISTINQRLRHTCSFYRWAYEERKIDELPFRYENVHVTPGKKDHMLSHVDVSPTSTRANSLTLREHAKEIRALSREEIRKFRTELSTTYQLIADWMLFTGMRRKEVAGLTHLQIPGFSTPADRDQGLHPIRITITKGGRPRNVFAPRRLIDHTNWYIAEERDALRKKGRRLNKKYKEPEELFLTDWGSPMTPNRITERLSQAFKAVDIHGATGHYLRHTFAVNTLVQLPRLAREDGTDDFSPLKKLQVLMGHESIMSTGIYLRYVETNQPEIVESLEYLYGEIVPA